jgi:hypothetical protein
LKKSSGEPKEVKRSRFQKFEVVEMNRSQIKTAPYNPRRIDPAARKNLIRSLKNHGMIETLVYNKVTGNLVSGHQRLSVLDDLHEGKDYKMQFAVVEMTEVEEMQANIAMNNQFMQGEFDLRKLSDLVSEQDDVPAFLEGAVLRTEDLEVMFTSAGEDPSWLDALSGTDAQREAVDEINEMLDEADVARKAGFGKRDDSAMEGDEDDEEGEEGESSEEGGDEDSDMIKLVEARRKKYAEGKAADENENSFYKVITFSSDRRAMNFMGTLGLPVETTTIDAESLFDAIWTYLAEKAGTGEEVSFDDICENDDAIQMEADTEGEEGWITDDDESEAGEGEAEPEAEPEEDEAPVPEKKPVKAKKPKRRI